MTVDDFKTYLELLLLKQDSVDQVGEDDDEICVFMKDGTQFTIMIS